MNLQQLKYVIEVEKCKSINKAARNLFVSQPSISSAIKELEDDIQIKIFNRTTSGVVVTEIGAAFIEDARNIINQTENLGKKYTYSQTKAAIKFRVAAYPSDSVTKAGANLILNHNHPDEVIDLSIYAAPTYQAIDYVSQDKVDIGIISYYNIFDNVNIGMIAHKDVEFHLLREFAIRVAVDKSHPLANTSNLKLEDLAMFPCIDPRTAISEYISEILAFSTEESSGDAEKVITPNKIIKTDNMDLINYLLKEMNAITFLSYYENCEKKVSYPPNFKVLDVYLGNLKETRGWIKRKDKILKSHEKEFVKQLENYFEVPEHLRIP
ncbi:MAG: LysR family transcriptional regulator [Eubacteriales bacterium]|nr:LysR family transcriptional regulator [Eubacteriales bacterium]